MMGNGVKQVVTCDISIFKTLLITLSFHFSLCESSTALEQEIKTLKGSGGIVGLTQEEEALDLLGTIAPVISKLAKSFLWNSSSYKLIRG